MIGFCTLNPLRLRKISARSVHLFHSLPSTYLLRISQIMKNILEIMEIKHKFHRENRVELQVLVVGIPNVGKSTLINALRNNYFGKGGKAMATGPYAGVTKSVSERLKISHSPPVYLVDTPGILEPELATPETAFRLGLCGMFRSL